MSSVYRLSLSLNLSPYTGLQYPRGKCCLLTSSQDGGIRAACRGDGVRVGGNERMEAGFEGPPGVSLVQDCTQADLLVPMKGGGN